MLSLAASPVALALSGGVRDSAHRYPQVLTLSAGQRPQCSAVKIGPHTLLTAAHCVVDAHSAALAAAFRPGGEIRVDNRAEQTGQGDAITVVIAETLLPRAYRNGLAKFADYRRRRLAELGAADSPLPAATLEQGLRMRHHFAARYPDVAVLRLQTATASIPVLEVDLSPLRADTQVTLVGFGCSDPGRLGEAAEVVRRSGRSRVIRVDAVNFYTDAGQRAAHAPSLCPGDSGGPVLHQGRVVGVHTVVFGLNRRHGARSNMAVNLAPLADWSAWP